MVKAHTETKRFYHEFWDERRYCLDPVEEIFEAACLLDKAVEFHFDYRYADADRLIRMADQWKIFHWSEMLWGKNNSWIHRLREDPNKPAGSKNRQPVPIELKQEIIKRDGYFCQFCRIPVIPSEVRKKMREYYPDALRWGSKNSEQHSAFQAMWLVLDHIIPQALGGINEMDNLVVACQPCNNARGDNTLNELGLVNPLSGQNEDGRRSKDWETYWLKYRKKYWKKYRNKALVQEWNGLQKIL